MPTDDTPALVVIAVPHREGARFSDGTGYRQLARSRFTHSEQDGATWAKTGLDVNPWVTSEGQDA